MFVETRGSIFRIIQWQWKSIAVFILVSTAIVLADHFLPTLKKHVAIPAFALGVVGGAIGIFVSFRTNSCYDRWWEGRKLWGRLVNTSRMWTSQVMSHLPRDAGGGPSDLQRRLVHRQAAYVHVLRTLLRKQDPFADEDVLKYLTEEEKKVLPSQSNVTHALLQSQLDAVAEEARRGNITQFQLQLFDQSITHLLDIQGGCERIKKTPFPRGYEYVADRLIMAFSFILPIGLVGSMGWATIPIFSLGVHEFCAHLGSGSGSGRSLHPVLAGTPAHGPFAHHQRQPH